MSTQEIPKASPGYRPDRLHETANRLITPALLEEVYDMEEGGYAISFGETPEPAYEDPDAVFEMHHELDTLGKEFRQSMGRANRGAETILSYARMVAPMKVVRNWAKKRLSNSHDLANKARGRLLYERLDVQGEPWHHQGGKALALGTITDAHELKAVTEHDAVGIYDKMSGRLTPDIQAHIFGPNAGELSGKTLQDALIETSMTARKKTRNDAERFAARQIEELGVFTNQPVYPGFKKIVQNCVDGLGIRARKGEVHKKITSHVETIDDEVIEMMSVGCGTALPMLEVMRDLKDAGRSVRLILIDQDPIALAAAEQFAIQMGLENDIEIHCKQLFKGNGRKTRVLNIDEEVLHGRKIHVGEDSGLREYFPDTLYVDLTKQVWESLSDNGIMTTGNMNINRSQPEFLHGLMGWPIPVKMRHPQDLAHLHEKAGVPVKTNTEFVVTQEGTYTLAFSTKSAA
jgi:hypothetical protein